MTTKTPRREIIITRDVIKEYLEANNYIVDEASNGIEALEKLENNKYDLLILDIMMKELEKRRANKLLFFCLTIILKYVIISAWLLNGLVIIRSNG